MIDPTKVKNDNYLLEVDNPVVVPVNTKVRLVLTANDFIYSWIIPPFGVKQDAVQCRVRDTSFKAEKIGTYRRQCMELCGKDHAFMPIMVNVVNDADYKTWILDELKTRGEKVFCAVCHQQNGKDGGAFPGLDGDPVVNGKRAFQITTVLTGKGGMPA